MLKDMRSKMRWDSAGRRACAFAARVGAMDSDAAAPGPRPHPCCGCVADHASCWLTAIGRRSAGGAAGGSVHNKTVMQHVSSQR